MTRLTADAVHFAHQARPVLRGVSLALEPGAVVGLVGPNGAGKSTLVRLLAGLDRPSAGTVVLGDRPLAAWPRREVARVLALVPQDPRLEFPFTVLEAVLMGRTPYLGPFGFPGPHDLAVARAALAALEIDALEVRPIDALSGGERQRVFLARALAQEPQVLLLDEPTTHLDLRHQSLLHAVVRARCRRDGMAALTVLHDLNLAAAFCDHLVLLADGRVVCAGPPAAVLAPDVLEAVFATPVLVETHGPSGRRIVVPRLDAPAG
ncbi:MAG: ABC transporter ATP-binding protein [bacterium]|nr:ABC transporter ATP-binding protein [bacterium]